MTKEDRELLPHEQHDRPDPARVRRRIPWLVWSLWHPTGATPARQGGSWTHALAAMGWSRYVWIAAANLGGLVYAAYLIRPWDLRFLSPIAFGLALLAALAFLVDLLSRPLARLERQYAGDRLAQQVGERLGWDVSELPLVGVIHDERAEWPPGSFADSFAFLEMAPDGLVFHRLDGSWSIPRNRVECVAPARYMGGRGHPLVSQGLRSPAVMYQSESGAKKVVAVEWLAGVTPEQIARASDSLRGLLESWMLDSEPGTGPVRRWRETDG
ncbi:MAG: hypothetical protein GF320_20280 [Armatimonadia bacterium]|nr:hypothetical protein [Armatimonadia bacterium]